MEYPLTTVPYRRRFDPDSYLVPYSPVGNTNEHDVAIERIRSDREITLARMRTESEMEMFRLRQRGKVIDGAIAATISAIQTDKSDRSWFQTRVSEETPGWFFMNEGYRLTITVERR